MLGAFIIVFREIIEAGIIVGIVMAVTRGVPNHGRFVLLGLAGGLTGAATVALFTGMIANSIEGIGQEVLNASILGLAVVMLAWHTVWMARHGREMALELKNVGQQVKVGSRSLFALSMVIGVAVMREGSEVALFLYGLVVSSTNTSTDLLFGSGLGLLSGVVLSILTFFGLVAIPSRYIFNTTSLLITFLAAGLAAQSVFFLQQAGLVTALSQTAWDTSHILSDTSLMGKVFHTLIGYSDQPSVLQFVVYTATLLGIFMLSKLVGGPSRQRTEHKNKVVHNFS